MSTQFYNLLNIVDRLGRRRSTQFLKNFTEYISSAAKSRFSLSKLRKKSSGNILGSRKNSKQEDGVCEEAELPGVYSASQSNIFIYGRGHSFQLSGFVFFMIYLQQLMSIQSRYVLDTSQPFCTEPTIKKNFIKFAH